MILWSPFLEQVGDQAFWPFLNCILFIYGVAKSKKLVIKFPWLPYFWCTSSKPTGFLHLILVSHAFSSSSVNCPSLVSCWLLKNFGIGLSVTFGEFPSRFLKCSFHSCILSSWLAVFCFVLEVLFFAYFNYFLPCQLWLFIFYRFLLFYWFGLECIHMVSFGSVLVLSRL